jgi:hypothetical protein
MSVFSGFNPYTISAWFKFDPSLSSCHDPGETFYILAAHGDEENGPDIYIEAENSGYKLGVRRMDWNNSYPVWTSSNSYHDGKWHLVISSYDGSVSRVIVDNEIVASGVKAQEVGMEGTRFLVGGEYIANRRITPSPPYPVVPDANMLRHPWSGYIDQVRIYDREIGLGEAVLLWNAGAGI